MAISFRLKVECNLLTDPITKRFKYLRLFAQTETTVPFTITKGGFLAFRFTLNQCVSIERKFNVHFCRLFQTPVSIIGTDQGELGSPIYKSFIMLPSSNSISTINQQLNNLGTINKQLSTLSQQLCGLNQQSQNLQNFEVVNNLNTLQQLSISSVPNLNTIVNNSSSPSSNNKINNNDSNNNNHKSSNNNTSGSSDAAGKSGFQSNCQNGNPLECSSISNSDPSIVKQIQKPQIQQQQQQHRPESLIQSDLFLSNQELLKRLQTLSLGSIINSSYSPGNSFLYANSNHLINNSNNNNNSFSGNNIIDSMHHLTNNNNFNLLSTPSSVVNLTPSPTFSRSPFSSSPILDNSSPSILDTSIAMIDECNNNSDSTPLVASALSVHDKIDVKLRPPTPSSLASGKRSRISSARSSGSIAGAGAISLGPEHETIRQKSDKRVTLPDFTLHITDECGNMMNSKKVSPSSATPTKICDRGRSTSEKVSNRSQLMNEVQRTAWARHTTK